MSLSQCFQVQCRSQPVTYIWCGTAARAERFQHIFPASFILGESNFVRNYSKSEGHVESSEFPSDVLIFRCIAPLQNQSDSNATGVRILGQITDFFTPPPPRKIKGGVGELSEPPFFRATPNIESLVYFDRALIGHLVA